MVLKNIIYRKSQQEATFANARIADQQKFEQIVAAKQKGMKTVMLPFCFSCECACAVDRKVLKGAYYSGFIPIIQNSRKKNFKQNLNLFLFESPRERLTFRLKPFFVTCQKCSIKVLLFR